MDIIYISHGNQFIIADFLVRYYQLDDVQIVVQCSRQNALELQIQAAQKLTTLHYSALRFLFLPNRPYQLVYRVLKEVDSIYERFFEKTRPVRVFMFSRERHYTLLINRARAVGAKIMYVEEGASTYALSQTLLNGDVFSGRRLLRCLWGAVKKNWQGTLLWEVLGYPYRVYKSLKAVASSQDVQLVRLKISKFGPAVFTHDPVFDQAITVYPELAQKNIRANEYLSLPPDFRVQAPKLTMPPEKRFLMLMTHTNGVSTEKVPIFYRWLLYILNDIAFVNEAVVEIKPHPAEAGTGLTEAIRALGSDRIRLVDESARAVSAETLLANPGAGYKAVFAINSATFLYANTLRPNLPLYSIGRVLNDFLRQEKIPQSVLSCATTFDLPEFQVFKHIKHYTCGSKV